MASASKVRSIVHVMKSMAALGLRQAEQASLVSRFYYKNIENGLISCFKKRSYFETNRNFESAAGLGAEDRKIAAIVFGTEIGLVGPFNEQLAQYVRKMLAQKKGEVLVVGIGEKMASSLQDVQLLVHKNLAFPPSIEAISSFIPKILSEIELFLFENQEAELLLFHHRSLATGVLEPIMTKILPFQEVLEERISCAPWPTRQIPELIEKLDKTLFSLLKEYVFISLAQTCVESIIAENSSRFLCMQRAEKNIDEMVSSLTQDFHLLRQNSIDAELFDVLTGFSSTSS